jgi:hypothetical protein
VKTPAKKQTLAAEIVSERELSPYRGGCVYCGAPTYGRTCAAHRDLLATDPNYSELRARAAEPETEAPA